MSDALPPTRRDLLRALAMGAGAAALHSVRPAPVWAQQDDDVTQGVREEECVSC